MRTNWGISIVLALAGFWDELAGAIGQAVNMPFEVLDIDNNVIATETSNGDAISLPPGTYKVRLRNSTGVENTATIAADEETLVSLD